MSNMAQIEVLTVGGNWMRYGTCSKHPNDLQRMLNAALNAHSWAKKARAIDEQTKDLLDMAFK
jgi:hypothetical protein